MDFQIGADLGLVLAKGILFSFITVMVLLPPLTLLSYKLIDKTKHRPFAPSFKNINRPLSRLAMPVLLVVALLIVPSFLGQNKTGFLYGNASVAEGQGLDDESVIQETFGQSTIMMVLVPRGDIAREKQLSEDLLALKHVTSVISYPIQVGTAIPVDFLKEEITSQFYSENFARIIVYTDTPEEGDLAFATVESITSTAKRYYGEEVWSAGQSANLYDMCQVVEKDKLMVDLIAIAFIFCILLITFRSALLPILLLLAIQAAIWINLAIPYFMGTPINFIGFLVLSTVQLAATVDYAILLSINYMRARKTLPQKEAMHQAMGMSFRPILVSAVILSSAGFALFATSTNSAISDIGMLLGRGSMLAFALVACFLPAMFKLLDRGIAKTTWRAGFFIEEAVSRNEGSRVNAEEL
jgi:predicted RND superfamily exporter protein